VNIVREGCGVDSKNAEVIVDELAEIGAQYGLFAHLYSSKALSKPFTGHALGGQMLQIFISRKEVEHLVYRSLAYGYAHEDTKPISEWLYPQEEPSPPDPIDGQVRILCRPDVLVDPSRARVYHYCANWEFFGGSTEDEGSRAAFVQDIRKILGPLMKVNDVKKRITAPGPGIKDSLAKQAWKGPVAKVAAVASKAAAAVGKSAAAPPSSKSAAKSGSAGYPDAHGKKKGKKKK